MAKQSNGDLLEQVRSEIETRMVELRPYVEEHAQLLAAAESLTLDGDAPAAPRRGRRATAARRARPAAAKPAAKASRRVKRAPAGKLRGRPSAAQQAIEAALEHGSHTLAELVLVTAIETAPIRAQLGKLQKAGIVSRVRREGKTAYSLLSATAAASADPRKGASAK